MRSWTDKSLGRREFLTGAARSSLAAGLTGAATLLVVRPHGTPGDCTQRILCGRCNRFDGCELPKAQRARGEKGAADA
jgi:hypothetical protein